VRVGLQYTDYLEFNGGRAKYDGSGRNASDNNTAMAATSIHESGDFGSSGRGDAEAVGLLSTISPQ
jgi:hypothetical protein